MGDVHDLHEHLKNLIDKSYFGWTYAILWECSSRRQVLTFKDGYHRGSGKGNPKQVRLMGSCVTVTEDATDDNDDDAATQWFFKISMSQSFELSEDLPDSGDLPAHAFTVPTSVWVNVKDREADSRYKWGMWERTKWAHQFGIRTFLCLPFQDKRVLELASTEIIPYDIQWIQHNVHLIQHIGTLTRQQQRQLYHYALKQEILRRIDEQPLVRLRDELNEGAVNEMKNRGKEKISDSKCSWTILTDSSDRGTDRTFSCSHDYSGPS